MASRRKGRKGLEERVKDLEQQMQRMEIWREESHKGLAGLRVHEGGTVEHVPLSEAELEDMKTFPHRQIESFKSKLKQFLRPDGVGEEEEGGGGEGTMKPVSVRALHDQMRKIVEDREKEICALREGNKRSVEGMRARIRMYREDEEERTDRILYHAFREQEVSKWRAQRDGTAIPGALAKIDQKYRFFQLRGDLSHLLRRDSPTLVFEVPRVNMNYDDPDMERAVCTVKIDGPEAEISLDFEDEVSESGTFRLLAKHVEGTPDDAPTIELEWMHMCSRVCSKKEEDLMAWEVLPREILARLLVSIIVEPGVKLIATDENGDTVEHEVTEETIVEMWDETLSWGCATKAASRTDS